ncbi:MAG TPA: UDP-2,3-diacylglucosamine diphosphatase [Steroidobacteraceae bacterium]|nr:UDP-2,3-diacylglucosamine diphosphatase [Steroidobacteraceae bacterium]
MRSAKSRRATQVRTLFLSDIHLGFRQARVRELADFLAGIEAREIILAGDIIDALSLSRRFFWSGDHTSIIRTLLAKRRAGARLVFIPGNHDASLAVLAEMLQGQLEVHREWVHRTGDGKRLLVIHGDQFDGIVPCAPWLTRLGDALYYVMVGACHHVNDARRALGKPYWPLAERIKLGIGPSVRYIERFEQVAANHARSEGYDGIVCGHIHRANLRQIDGMVYCNTGDWVESCTALIETREGELQLLQWPNGRYPVRRATAQLMADAA